MRDPLTDPRALRALALVVALLGAAVAAVRRRDRVTILGLALLAVPFVPASNAVRAARGTHSQLARPASLELGLSNSKPLRRPTEPKSWICSEDPLET